MSCLRRRLEGCFGRRVRVRWGSELGDPACSSPPVRVVWRGERSEGSRQVRPGDVRTVAGVDLHLSGIARGVHM